jgi:ribonucleoside-diphosphate reductase alpha chain
MSINPDTNTEKNVPNINTYGLTDLGYKIFLDRYALKDLDRSSLQVGDTVIAVLNDSKDMNGKREVSIITSINEDDTATILTQSGDELTLRTEYLDKPLEIAPSQMHQRVAKGVASVERDDAKQEEWSVKFEWLMDDWKFIPGGRILTMAGSGHNLSAFNCFVIGMPKDSRAGIIDTLEEMSEIMSRGGGVGINVSSLRPKNSYVKGVNGRSSGAVSFGALYSFMTGLISQAGSRRGALMLILNDNHPDILNFIDSKKTAGNITNANISVGISDRFMDAVKADQDWDLIFPDTSYPGYDEEWDGNIEKWQANGNPVVVYRTIKAREMWMKIIESAWGSAEPGLWFRDRANKMSNSYYYDNGYLICTNPCGEQSLSANAVCNLGAINLSKFSLLGDFIPVGEIELESALEAVDWDALSMATRYAIRFLDDVIDHTYYVTEANKEQEQGERRVGLGIMGLAELMVRIGIRYGSEDSIEFIERIMHFIARESYISSAEIAEEKGSFKWFDAENFLNSGFMQNMDQDVKDIIREKGIRNVTLNTIAPTGTTSTMVETSGGIEPYFSFVFYRQGRLGVHEQRVELAEKWVQTHGSEESQDLPSFFVTAMDLPPEEHVRTMAAAQKWVDSSISKTCNVPNDYTIEQTEQLYMQMYDLGCKGGTIYRDGSRNEQVLHLENPEEKKIETVVAPEPVTATYETAQDFSTRNKRRPSLLNGVTFQVATPYATNAYVTVNEDENRYPYEVFITVGKAGSDLQAQAESIGRLISKSIQIMPPYLRFDGLREIVLQLVGIGGNRSTGFGPNQVRSLPDAIGSSIIKMYIDKRDLSMQAEEQIEQVATLQLSSASDTMTAAKVSTNLFATVTMNGNGNGNHAHSVNGVNAYNNNTRPAIKSVSKASAMTETCPDCHNMSLVREEGCKHCHNCGYSEC